MTRTMVICRAQPVLIGCVEAWVQHIMRMRYPHEADWEWYMMCKHICSQMNVAIAAMIAGCLRHRRRDHAVARIHDTPLRDLCWLSSTETLVTWTGCRTGLSYQEVECFVVQDKSELTSYVYKDIVWLLCSLVTRTIGRRTICSLNSDSIYNESWEAEWGLIENQLYSLHFCDEPRLNNPVDCFQKISYVGKLF